jgi:anhydro-N-acetylmuramic acid kinase
MAELYIGLMSGTSMDGVDAALVDFQTPTGRLVGTRFLSYSETLRDEALALNGICADEMDRAARLGNSLAELYAQCIHALLSQCAVPANQISAIGCHGQTVRHRPELGYTVQLGNPSLLAERTGIPVIADFRSRDIAAGGQGAPLVPAFHAACFRSAQTHRVILNIGGIANLTDLAPVGAVRGFDTGPGNLLLDQWCQRHTGARFDRDGAWAAQGAVIDLLLADMLSESFFHAAPPKSTGRDLFNAQWLAARLPERYAPVDVQATLLELSAQSIAQAMSRFCTDAKKLYVCGGGAHNRQLMQRLSALLPSLSIGTTAALGLDPDWVEAAAFAWLARARLHQLPGNLPEVTGALGPRILGALYPA